MAVRTEAGEADFGVGTLEKEFVVDLQDHTGGEPSGCEGGFVDA